MADTGLISQDAVAASKHFYDAAYKTILDKTNDVRTAIETAASSATHQMEGPGITSAVLGTAVSLLADLLTLAMDQITQAKKQGQIGLHDLIASTLSDALLIEVDPADIPTGTNANGQFRVNAALGGKFLEALKTFMGAAGPVTGDSAEAAVKAFLGFGMQLSVNTGLLAMIGGAIPFEHFNEIKEIGEMLEKSLGVGRLTRQFLAPYIQEFVRKPLERSLAAKALQTLPTVSDLVHGLHSGVISAAEFSQYAQQHGLNAQFTSVLLNRYTPRATAREFVTSEGYGLTDPQSSADGLQLDGIPAGLVTLRLTLERKERAAQLARPLVEKALSLAERGLIDPAEFESILTTAALAPDETDAFRKRLLFVKGKPARHLSHGDMLFLYEAGQITLDQVGNWAAAEGFSSEDQLNLQLLFTLKAAAASHTKTGGAAARAVHLHNEHVAFVTDEITGIWSRPPTAAELTYWVEKLDVGDRTKHDFVTELKTLPTTGPAIPPTATATP